MYRPHEANGCASSYEQTSPSQYPYTALVQFVHSASF